MKVKDLMTSGPTACAPGESVALAARLMLENDFGILPITYQHRLVGVVTDRDLFIALATRGRPASELTVGEVVSPQVWTCTSDDDVRTALATMKEHRVRRLPVVGADSTLIGMISMNDILLAAGPRRAVRSDEVLDALQSICAHHQPLVRPQRSGR